MDIPVQIREPVLAPDACSIDLFKCFKSSMNEIHSKSILTMVSMVFHTKINHFASVHLYIYVPQSIHYVGPKITCKLLQ